jgi:serine/threonine protein kinase
MKRYTCSDFDDANNNFKEINNTLNLNHKNVIKYKDVFLNYNESSDIFHLYFIMPFYKLGDLSSLISKHYELLNLKIIFNFSYQIITSIEYIHQ